MLVIKRTMAWALTAGSLLGFSLAPVTAQAASGPSVIYVSPTGSDASGQGTASAPYQTLQHAVNATPANGVVMVEPGTYAGSVTITSPVELVADPTQTQPAVLDASGQNNGITISGPGASGTEIVGLTVEHANNHGIFDELASDVTIAYNQIVDNGLAPTKGISENKPIELVGTSHVMVLGNTVTGNQADGGIGIADDGKIDPGAATPGATTAAASNNTIEDNTIVGNKGGCGVVIASYNSNAGVLHNQVIGNTISKNVAGIVVAADPPGTQAIGNVVSDNTVTGNFIPGIIVHSNAPHQVVSNTVITGNQVSGNGADLSAKQTAAETDGIAIIGAVDPVTNTVVADNQISQEHYGVWMWNAQNTVGLSSNTTASVAVAAYGASAVPSGSNSGTTKTYTVRSGDSLWSIAANELGNGNLWNSIYAANKAAIGSNPNFLQVGEVLAIPAN